MFLKKLLQSNFLIPSTQHLAPFLITAVLFSTLVGLGVWQIERLQWKENLIITMQTRMRAQPKPVEALPVDEVDYHTATAEGIFVPAATIYEHAVERGSGQGGYHVMTPLKLTSGKYLLVDRGFIPFAARGGGYMTPEDVVSLRGFARVPHHSMMQPANDPAKGEWYWPDIAAVAATQDAVKGAEFLPFILVADAEGGSDHLPRGGQIEMNIPNDHKGYAITWFTLAGALLVIYGISIRRKVS